MPLSALFLLADNVVFGPIIPLARLMPPFDTAAIAMTAVNALHGGK